MAASRASSLRALRQLSASSHQVRHLSITGHATFSSVLTSERPALNFPRDVAGLRSECQKRKLPTTGSRAELLDRLNAFEVTNTRAFSTGVQDSKRPTAEASAAPAKPARHFNTSRSLKAVGDTSTIDFAYLPDFDPDTRESPVIRVPILPQTVASKSTEHYNPPEAEDTVMKPQIMTVSADGTHIHAPSAMSEVSDNNSVDFQGMAARMASKVSKPLEEQASIARQMWSSFLDDALGPKQGASKA